MFLGVILGLAALVIVRLKDEDANRSVEQRLAVSANAPKLVPFKVLPNEILTMSVEVVSGSPVDVRIVTKMTKNEGGLVVESAGFEEGVEVRTFRLEERWPFPTPAIVVISSNRTSEVVLKMNARPN